MECRLKWAEDWKQVEKRPCCPHVQPAAALPPHHSTSLQGWSAGDGARQSWWTHCHPALHHSGKDLKETITLSKCLRPSMKSSLVSVDRREHIALNKQIGFGLEYMNKCVLFIQNRTTMKCAFTCIIGRKTSKVTLSSALCSTTSFFTSLSVGFWGSRVIEKVTLCFRNSIHWQWWERWCWCRPSNDIYDNDMRCVVELNLAKCSHHVADLADRDLPVAALVVQQERFLSGFNRLSLFIN